MNNRRWDEYFLSMAYAAALKSKDPSTHVGAVLVDEHGVIRATGYNGFPRRVLDDDRLNNRELKLQLTVHAEANAICAAARVGVPLYGCDLYCTMHPCVRCTALAIQCGIQAMWWPKQAISERWAADFKLAEGLMDEASILYGEL